jgi:prepilin-type N-terminal cleavage/methylation domain-containing protein
MPEVRKEMHLPANRTGKGFSLVEVLVVVMIILVIAAIAVPNMLKARMKANEAAAVANMRTINTAETMYFNAYPQVGFAGNLADLGSHGSNCESPGKTNSCIITDDALTSGLKNGYTFDLVGDGQVPSAGYNLTAAPESNGATGRCNFSSTQSGSIQVEIPNPTGITRFSLGETNNCDHS